MWVLDVLEHPTLSPTAKNIGVAISIHMNGDTRQAWPSHPRLARMCSVAKRTAERATQELERAGLLLVSRKANCSNRYEMRRVPTGETVGTDQDDDRVPTAVTVGTDASVGGYRRQCRPNLLI
jgi:hypothetical protein